jgi:hypothetical protein
MLDGCVLNAIEVTTQTMLTFSVLVANLGKLVPESS